MTITQSINNSAKVKQKQTEIFYADQPCVSKIIYPSGSEAAYYNYRPADGGKRKRIFLGDPTVTPLHQIFTKADEIRRDIANGISPTHANLSIREFFYSHYFPWAMANKRSWRDDLSRFNSHILEPLGDARINTLISYQIQQVLDGMIANEYAPATRNKVLALLRKALNLACDWNMAQKKSSSKNPIA